MTPQAQRLVTARARLVLEHPFFGALALRLRFREDPECQSIWTDGRTLGFNPDHVARLSNDALLGSLAHDVMHLACQHHTRRGERNPSLWNAACDLAINSILLASGFSLPGEALDDRAYHDMSADEIYSVLSNRTPPETRDSERSEEADDPEGSAGEGASSDAAESKRLSRERAASDSQGDDNEHESPLQGAAGQRADPGGTGEIRDAVDAQGQTGTPGGPADAASQWRAATQAALDSALAQGAVPAQVLRAVRRVVVTPKDWRDVLSEFLKVNARNDYSWSPPNRRHVHAGLYLPSPRNMEIDRIVVVLDTSGSISQPVLDRFGAELSAILEAHEAEVDLLHADMRVTDHHCYTRADLPLTLAGKGGGGTDFRPAFDYVQREDLRPACLIYLTDLESSAYPAREPEYPVLWAHIGPKRSTPPFGEVITL